MSTRHSFLSTTGLIRPPSRTTSNASILTHSRQANPNGTKTGKRSHAKAPLTVTKAGILPLGPTFIVGIAVAFSLIFIVSISLAFVGSDDDEPPFKGFLDSIATDSPGIVLLGDNVDIDVDEPSVTIRWSIIGCGLTFILPGSEGTHGSALCGLPSIPLKIYVDSAEDPAATYDPTLFPIANKTGHRLSIQNLCQFDSDHVLDVHEARLYPFDTYHLTSTLSMTSSSNNNPTAMSAISVLRLTSSFAISHKDIESYANTSDNSYTPSRDITLDITRPAEARLFALLLFGTTWMFAHATVGFTVLAWIAKDEHHVLRSILFDFLVLLAIPQLRMAMPDAPGLDGVLLDSIGFFPQMLMSGASAIVLVTKLAREGLRSIDDNVSLSTQDMEREAGQPIAKGIEKLRRQGTSTDFRHVRSWSRAAFVADRR